MGKLQLRGLYPATVTPFTESYAVDWDALDAHLAHVAASEGVQGLVVNGGVAELLTLKADERPRVIQRTLDLRGEGQLVIAGIEARNADDAVAMGVEAREAGAEALLVLPPFDQRALRKLATHTPAVMAFFERLDREVGLPMIVFQYPQKSGCAYDLATLEALAGLEHVVGIKAAAQDVTDYIELYDRLGDRLSVLAASDSPPLLGMLLHGTHGALIGISAIEPASWAQILAAAADGDATLAVKRFQQVALPIMSAVFENQKRVGPVSDAAAVKEALVALGQLPSSRVRPPAVDVTDEDRRRIREAVEAAGLR